jgi:hypothetical protein
MSELKYDPPPGAFLYSEKLLGLRSECPACGEWEHSTGWLLYREDYAFHWYVDLKCLGCRSRGSSWRRDWMPLIEDVVQNEKEEIEAPEGPPDES